MESPDAGPACAAQGGDAASFAAPAERHRAGLRATAISLLGYRTGEVDDAAQDALITAFRGLPVLREPAAGDFVNPPSDPDHCPPTFAWLLRLREGRVARLGVAYGEIPRA
ncbi:RNA polymerase sigma factor [Catenuloplanes atrovinosus]|uniref:Uncharacterized protein n=1 Tax=Catenuloplanes atrovinosus TaxID=137266 RepID=A0AAE3YKF5_9ACTN|nr:hypothetical protein [Catenuloplanes atrovinosus]MDR7274157.1 hypothetical protein [Catenuloplanes atrovinosus]